MKRTALIVMTLAIFACVRRNDVAVRKVSVSAINAIYSPIPQSNVGILSFDLLVRNEGTVAAQLGCGLLIERETKMGHEPIQHPACSLPEWDPRRQESIAANSTDTIKVRVNIPQDDIDEMATYRTIPSVAFGPDFKTASSFASESFRVTKK
jgi:hypothetical protein